MAKRGYRGKHPNNDMKVAPTEHKAANNAKLTVEYNKTGAKNKYDYIKSHDGFFPQSEGSVTFAAADASNDKDITIISTDGTTKVYTSGAAEILTGATAIWKRTGDEDAKRDSLIACINAPDIGGIKATCTVTFSAIQNLVDTTDTVGVTDNDGTTHTFTIKTGDNVTTGNLVGIAAALADTNNATTAAEQFCKSVEDPGSTAYQKMSCDNSSGVVTLTQYYEGTSGNQSIVADDLTGASTLTEWVDGAASVKPGHSGKITASADGTGKVKLVQDDPGPDGDTTVTCEALTKGTAANFTGG